MKAIILLIVALITAGGVGRVLLGKLHIFENSSLERFVYSVALGLGITAYGVLFLGLIGQLRFLPVTVWCVLLMLAGAPGTVANFRDLVESFRSMKTAPPVEDTKVKLIVRLAMGFVFLLGAASLIACFQPPTGREWDVLSYHLANPKVFLAEGRIRSLPTDHHSNFPFVMEMLFVLGLLYESYPLANMFHWLTGALTVMALVAYCHRRFDKPTGWFAALLFVSTPLALWEASTAYIDVAVGLYLLLSVFAVVSAIETREEKARTSWVVLAGFMMGFALGLKYLSLLPLTIVGMLLLIRGGGFKQTISFFAIALVIGSPWYVKNVVLLNNPVYPFFFKVFPQSKYWSADRAAAYQMEQDHFGYKFPLSKPGELLSSLFQTPFRLIANADKYANAGDYTFSILVGGLFTGLCFSLLYLRRVPPVVLSIVMVGVVQVIAWFFLAQISRYLVSLIPLFGVGAGYAASRWVWQSEADGISTNATTSLMRRGLSGATICFLFLQPVMMAWAVLGLPSSGREAAEHGTLPVSLAVGEDVGYLLSPEKREATLKKQLDLYPAIEWINANSSKSAGVILFDETRGFYLERPYLWGNGEHASYIPYETMKNGHELNRWLREHGIEYALLNTKFAPQNNGADPTLPSGPVGQESVAVQQWYVAPADASLGWRTILGDAIRKGGWTVEFAQYGVVVMRVREGAVIGVRQRSRGSA